MISSSVQHPISLIFAIHVSFIIPLSMMWILLTNPMQKSMTTVCLHCSFARLKNKHIGVLGTNVATISWLHWSPVSGYSWSCVVWWDTKIVGDVTLYSFLSDITYCHRAILSPIESSLGLFSSFIILLSKICFKL